MSWFEGSTESCVEVARMSGRIMVLYVEGVDDVSFNLTSILKRTEVMNAVDRPMYIALKINDNSKDYWDFVEIYEHVPVPSIFLLGEYGVPLALIHVSCLEELDTLTEKLLAVLKKYSGKNAHEAVRMLFNESKWEDNPFTKAVLEVHEDWNVLESRIVQIGVNASVPKPEPSTVSASEVWKSKSEVDAEVNADSSNTETCPENVYKFEDRLAKVQFRRPDGSTHTQVFPYELKLKSVHSYVKNNLENKRFKLAIPFHCQNTVTTSKIFGPDDESKTLEELSLTPRAVILILPIHREPNVISYGISRITSLFWYLAMPVITFIHYLSSFIFGGGPRSQSHRGSSNTSSHPPPPPPPSYRPQQTPSQYRRRTTKTLRGNIHTLSSEDDDNANNTYNGNSTQQMP
ncbi:UBX domain-containing protein 4-like [Lycorma delicatula]|uniref:UBX domain-containing protein 4-like n=1 Tax=Lycorma delicatula TaxID=130591 RepID=UPI003F514841